MRHLLYYFILLKKFNFLRVTKPTSPLPRRRRVAGSGTGLEAEPNAEA
jgi:hypothetical protein